MILYFSGTGNSAYVAKKLSEQLGDTDLNLTYCIKNSIHDPIHSDKPWIIVVPTYAWQIPHIVADWIRQTELTGSKRAYFVMTCGDDNGNAAKYNAQLCREKGWSHMGTAKVVMPENYIALFDAPEPETARRIVSAACRTIQRIGNCILLGNKLPERRSGFKDKILSGPVNAGFNRFYVRANKFYTKDNCTGCDLCARLCPTNNIKLKDNRPVWSDFCVHCMACICGCPMEAIEYGKTSVGKARYKCPEV